MVELAYIHNPELQRANNDLGECYTPKCQSSPVFIYCGAQIPFTPAAATTDQLELQVNRSRISIAMCLLADTKLCVFLARTESQSKNLSLQHSSALNSNLYISPIESRKSNAWLKPDSNQSNLQADRRFNRYIKNEAKRTNSSIKLIYVFIF